MRKIDMAYLFIETVEGKDPSFNNKFDPRDVMMHMGPVANDMIAAIIDKNRGNIADGYITTAKNVPILFDTDRELKYIEFPYVPIQLWQDTGIRMIAPMKGESSPFIQQKSGQAQQMAVLEVGNLGLKTYTPEGMIAILRNVPINCDKVLLKYLRDFSSYFPEEELRLPAGTETAIFDKLLERMLITENTTQDKSNDNNSAYPQIR